MRWNVLKGHDMAAAHRCTPLRKVVLDLFNIREVQHKCNNSNLRDWEIQVQVYIIFSALYLSETTMISHHNKSVSLLRVEYWGTNSMIHFLWAFVIFVDDDWWRLAWENWVNIRANTYCDREYWVQCVIVASSITHSLPSELDSDEIFVTVQ